MVSGIGGAASAERDDHERRAAEDVDALVTYLTSLDKK
jgi:hypothetical protein